MPLRDMKLPRIISFRVSPLEVKVLEVLVLVHHNTIIRITSLREKVGSTGFEPEIFHHKQGRFLVSLSLTLKTDPEGKPQRHPTPI